MKSYLIFDLYTNKYLGRIQSKSLDDAELSGSGKFKADVYALTESNYTPDEVIRLRMAY